MLLPGSTAAQQLQLAQVEAVDLPTAFVPSGAILVSESSRLLWGPTGMMLLGEAGAVRWIPFQGGHEIRGLRVVSMTPFLAEGIDRQSNFVVHFDDEGKRTSARRLPLVGSILQAEFTSGVWAVLIARGGDTLQLWTYESAGHEVRIAWERNPANDILKPTVPLRLSRVHNDLAVTEVRAPFRIWRGSMGADTLVFTELVGAGVFQDILDDQHIGADGVAALSLLALDSGFLSFLSVLTDDRRVVTWHGPEGDVQRSTVWDVAVGPLGSMPSYRQLLLLRDIGVHQVVLYRWDWSTDSTQDLSQTRR